MTDDKLDPIVEPLVGGEVSEERDADGYRRDEFGFRIDEEGRRVDEDGAPVDVDGEKVDPIDDEGGIIPPLPPRLHQ